MAFNSIHSTMALNSNDQDSLNSAAGGNFLDKMPRECLKIIESKSKVRQSRSKAVIAKVGTSSSTPAVSSDVAELKDLVRALLLDKKKSSSCCPRSLFQQRYPLQVGISPGKQPNTNWPKEDLKGITTRSGVTTQGPTIPPTTSTSINRDTEVTKDTMPPTNNGSTKDVQPPVVQVQSRNQISKPDVESVSAPKVSIPFPSRRNDENRREKANEQIEKFYEIFKDMNFEISFLDALTLMPKFAST
ncbi:hypothetical protein Tco_1532104 [Tanacetum coccineum]